MDERGRSKYEIFINTVRDDLGSLQGESNASFCHVVDRTANSGNLAVGDQLISSCTINQEGHTRVFKLHLPSQLLLPL
jgi:hypothetical protein